MIVHVSFVHHGEGGEAHVSVSSPFIFNKLSAYADNLDEVVMEGLNGLLINVKKKKVVQSYGYTKDCGLYIEHYGG